MAFSLFAPPTVGNWAEERRRREGEAGGPYERAITATRRDVGAAARGAAGPTYGAAAARDAAQAMAPEIARLRAEQANAVGAVDAGVRRDIQAEIAGQNDFMNSLLGGLAGIGGQVMGPLIGGLGNGGTPAGPAAAAAPMMAAPPRAPARAPVSSMGLLPLEEAAPFAPASSPLGLMGETEEERRRRLAMGGGGLGGMLGAAAPIAGMANPAVGLGLGAAGRLFG
jgi:hypothetical protein